MSPTTYTLQASSGGPGHSLNYREALNEDQLRAVTEGDGHVLVLAGPGSGKTRTLIYRVAYLLEKGIPAQQILLVTFTVKAAREMLGRVEALLGRPPEGLWGGTFHHIGNLMLRQHAETLRFTPQFTILDEEDSHDVVAACLADLKIPKTDKRIPQPNVIHNIISFAVNTQQSLENVVTSQYPYFLDNIPLIQTIANNYAQRKRRANAMDYDDMLVFWLKLMREHSDISRHYLERFRYVLVDEYQDTNRLQFNVVNTMGQGHGNILAVGDDAQSIYAFRGADVNNLLEFPKQYPDTKIFRLEKNYRSTPEILEVANTSIQNNIKQFPKTLHAMRPTGSLPAVVALMNSRQQAMFIAQRILELREEQVPMQQVAILMRARYQAAELELELTRRNIPYVVRGGVRFFEQTHIKDVLAFLKLLVNPTDELAWERTLRLQEGIGPAYARRIREKIASQATPLESAWADTEGATLDLPLKARTGWKRFHQTISVLKIPEAAQRPGQLIADVIQRGYRAYVEGHFENARDRLEDLAQLANFADSYDSTEIFLTDLSLREGFKGETVTGWESPDEHVILSTIHQAKGLEWKVVFVIGMSDGQFPHPKSLEDVTALEEERRLFYVAVTRAKDDLYLTYPMTRYSPQTGEILMKPSCFLQELPDTILDPWSVQLDHDRESYNQDTGNSFDFA